MSNAITIHWELDGPRYATVEFKPRDPPLNEAEMFEELEAVVLETWEVECGPRMVNKDEVLEQIRAFLKERADEWPRIPDLHG